MRHWILTSLLLAAPLGAYPQQSSGQQQHDYSEIYTDTLKEWYDQKKPMIVIDARSKEYFDNRVLPNAKWVPYNASDKEIKAAIPAKGSLVVVYCSNPRCPASQAMANRLVSMGYQNVYKYPDGLEGWLQNGYPTQNKGKT